MSSGDKPKPILIKDKPLFYLRNFTLDDGKSNKKLEDIYNFSDNEIEGTHDFIQIIFPLAEPSYWSSNKYFIETQKEIDNLSRNKNVKNSILKSASWYIAFLK